MTDPTPLQTPDEWLLAQYDAGDAQPHNHVRPLLELINDYPHGSTPEYPRWSGQANWPQPGGGYDLDRRDAAAARLAQIEQLTARRTA